MQAVEGVPTGFAISILKRNKVAPLGGSLRKKSAEPQTQVGKRGGRKTAAPRCPKLLRDSAAHISCRLSTTQAQGLIHIRAELGIPNAYPAPDSSVTTTSYARRIELPLGSGKV
jgi:hypothetical protein